MSSLPADVEAFTATMAQLLSEAGLGQDADLKDPELLASLPRDYLMDSLVVMRRVGLDPAETACLSAVYLGLNQALMQTSAGEAAGPWSGRFDALAEVGRKRLAQGRLEPLFLLFETALSEQMALRRRTMN